MDSVCDPKVWKRLENGKVRCDLCPFMCELVSGQTGVCRVRKHDADTGMLVLTNYAQTLVPVIDTLRKRPVYLFPASDLSSLSIGGTGCNNRCPFCQNFEISQVSHYAGLKTYSPENVVNIALDKKVNFISFSFNEVIVIYEYFRDVAMLAKQNGIKVCVKTAGYISDDYADDFIELFDTANVDIKPFGDEAPFFYMDQCGILDHGTPSRFLERIVRKGKHVEVSHILIEGVNDNPNSAKMFADLIGGIDKGIPVHILRHYPAWKSDYPVTSNAALQKFGEACLWHGLQNVFWGDVA